MSKHLYLVLFFIFSMQRSQAEDGYRLWLRYDRISNPAILQEYRSIIQSFSLRHGITRLPGQTGTRYIFTKQIRLASASTGP